MWFSQIVRINQGIRITKRIEVRTSRTLKFFFDPIKQTFLYLGPSDLDFFTFDKKEIKKDLL